MNSTSPPWETPHFGKGSGPIGTGNERTRGKEWRENGNRAGTLTRFIWGRDSEPLEKGWHLKPGPQTGGWCTKGVMTSRHGMSKPPLFFSRVCEIKTGKIGLFYSRISESSWAEGRQCLGTICPAMMSIHYGESCKPRSWSTVTSWGEKKDFSNALIWRHPFFCVYLLLFVHGMQHLVCMVWWMHENTFVIHLSILLTVTYS